MNSIFANTIYIGKSIVSDRYLIFKGTDITGLGKSANGQVLGRYDLLTPAFICWSEDPFDLASYPAAVYGEGELLFSE